MDLNQQAKLLAQANLEKNSSSVRYYQDELNKIEFEIKNAVNLEMNDLQRASNLLQDCKNEMERVRSAFLGIQQKTSLVQNTIKNFDDIEKVKSCRMNLRCVLQELEAFSQVPIRVKVMQQILQQENDPKQLKQVWEEWSELDIWKENLLQRLDIDSQQSIANAVAKHNNSNNKKNQRKNVDLGITGDHEWALSAVAKSQMRVILETHFKDVDAIGKRVWELVWQRIQNCMVLSQFDPASLVCAIEIIERSDRKSKRRHNNSNNKDENNFSKRYNNYPMRTECLLQLDLLIQQRLDKLLPKVDMVSISKRALVAPSSSSSSTVVAAVQTQAASVGSAQNDLLTDQLVNSIISGGTTLLFDLRIVADDMVKCFPPYYRLIDFFKTRYERRLESCFEDVCSAKYNLTAGHLLSLVSFSSQYNETLPDLMINGNLLSNSSSSTIGNQYVSPKLKDLSEAVMNRYVSQAMPRLTLWVQNIMKNREEYNLPQVANEGYLFTVTLYDLFSLLHEEVTVVGDRVRGQFMLQFFQACVGILELYQEEDVKRMAVPLEVGIEKLCAIINDNQKSQELCEALLKRCSGYMDDEGNKEAYLILDSIVSEFIRSAVYATSCIVDCIFHELAQVFQGLFEKPWEESIGKEGETIIATLEDFYEHPTAGLTKWIAGDFFLGKLVVGCLERLVKSYVERLVFHKKKFGSLARASNRIREDHRLFVAFFSRYSQSLLVFGGIRTHDELLSRFLVLSMISDYLQSRAPQMFLDGLLAELKNPHAVRRLLLFPSMPDQKRKELGMICLAEAENYSSSSDSTNQSTRRFDFEGVEEIPVEALGVFGEGSFGPFKRKEQVVKKRSLFSSLLSRASGGSSSAKKNNNDNKNGTTTTTTTGPEDIAALRKSHGLVEKQGPTKVLKMEDFFAA